MGSFSYTKEQRLRKRPQFLALGERGKRVQNAYFIAVFAPAQGKVSRLGVTVTKKVGGAVTRNRIKRCVREYFRLNQHRLKAPVDINVIAKKACCQQESPLLAASLDHLFNRVSEGSRH
ncbi:ribonuclease P protein component [Desulfatibacillum alkenivorans DSM 16219]|uniref:Ribonuclease P protein component n=1 Tax=Desulfatibacillum alkenivorans DSM 16219 TaxID=1121393 RepID=A0A1M6SBI5_9BACT|nr:ribonuclease P protein component [Desulfatibacillum alkenivorans]SHK42114.1 ribonuclease P protein component [Desulfatibacillum alkenivorans DSM 16219]